MVPLPRTQLDAVVLSVVLSAGLSVVEYLHHVVLTPYLCVLRACTDGECVWGGGKGTERGLATPVCHPLLLFLWACW